MNPRERILASLNHTQPDKMAVDFGGMCNTSMHVSCLDGLVKHYHLPPRRIRTMDPFTMVGIVDHDLGDAIGTDAVGVLPPGTVFGIPRRDWKPWTTFQGLEVLVPGGFEVTPDGQGGWFAHPQGDVTQPPSGHMPADSYYFDAVIRAEEVDEDSLNPADNVEEYRVVSDDDLAYYIEETQAARATGKAVVLGMPGMGLGDVAEIPGCSLKCPKGIRDIEEWYMAPLLYRDYVYEMFKLQTDVAMQNLQKIHAACGDSIDVVLTCAADYSHQTDTFFSKEIFRDLYMPHFKRANEWIHQNTDWKIAKHNCGAVEPFIPLLIESGFDILNPVQCSAVGMDPTHLKKEFGKDITFWGGGVDTQKTLPFGTPREVRTEVLERCEIFAKDGGFVFNAIHNIQAGTPLENIVAMLDAVHEFNGGE
ncbi:MAG: hypothetical protein LUC93_05030 [Planctomycetaceae bacterium]|nr:hypothetical protein [Planctomycetaceae bacterium]